MSLSIHVGAHKTATTYLERSIWTVEKQLLEQGYMYLPPRLLREDSVKLSQSLGDQPHNQKRRLVLTELLREITAESEHVLVSEEQILGYLGAAHFLGEEGRIYLNAGNRLRRLLQMFGTTDATIYLSVRSPASFLTSAYGEYFAFTADNNTSRNATVEGYLRGFDPAALRWSELVERLLATGAPRLVCWRFEDLAGVKEKLLGHMLNEDIARQVKNVRPIRLGLSQAAYEKILKESRGLQNDERRKLREGAMAEVPKKTKEAGLRIFDEAVHAQCDAVYAKDCDKIAAMPGVEFLRPDQPGASLVSRNSGLET